MSEASKVTAEEAFKIAFMCIKELKERVEKLERRVNTCIPDYKFLDEPETTE